MLDTPARQATSHRAGLRRLVLLDTPDPTKWVVSHLSQRDRLALAAGPYASVPDLLADARLASVGELVRRAGVEVRDEPAFRALCDAVRVDNPELMQAVVRLAAEVITTAGAVRADLPAAAAVSPAAAADLTEQLDLLVFPGFLAATAYEHLTAAAALPAGGAAAHRRPACQPGPGRRRPGHDPALRGRVRRAGGGRPARPAARLRRRRRLADRGAAGQPVRPEPADAGAGVGETGADGGRAGAGAAG